MHKKSTQPASLQLKGQITLINECHGASGLSDHDIVLEYSVSFLNKLFMIISISLGSKANFDNMKKDLCEFANILMANLYSIETPNCLRRVARVIPPIIVPFRWHQYAANYYMYSNTMSQLKLHNILSSVQFGFREKHSAELQLLRTVHDFALNLNHNQSTDAILLDFLRPSTKFHIVTWKLS